MTQQLDHQALDGHTPAAAVRFGPAPAMTLSPELAAAVLAEVWKASPERFGNFVKKAMITLWAKAPGSSANGHGHG